jgi:hypothetical protein
MENTQKRFLSISALGFLLSAVIINFFILPPLWPEIEWNTYKNEKFCYKVNYPSEWQIIEAKPREGNKTEWAARILLNNELQKVTFLEKAPKIWPGEFQICVYSNPGRLNIDEWIEKNEPQDVTGGSLLQEVIEISLNGMQAKRLSIFGFDHEIIEIVVIHKGYVYSLSFAGRNPNDPDQKEHENLYNQMLLTFNLHLK